MRQVGRLDLEGMTTGVPLTLTGCYLPDGADVRGAHLPALRLMQCLAENPSMPPLDAKRLKTQVLDLRDLTVIADARDGAVILTGAQAGGQLDASGATLTNRTGPALIAVHLQVDGSLYLNAISARASQAHGLQPARGFTLVPSVSKVSPATGRGSGSTG